MSELSCWLKLHHAPGLGPVGIQQLLQTHNSIEHIFASSGAALQQAGLAKPAIDYLLDDTISDAIQAELAWANAPKQHILTYQDADYPQQLARIHGAPAVLYLVGNKTLLNDPQLGIVGSRNPSRDGAEIALAFARDLAQSGLLITSGLALGIDTCAHQGALAAQTATVAVMATGADQRYPAQNRHLADSILEADGTLLTESPLGTKPHASLFPRRNRIISGLSLGTLVVEAAPRSGSLITAKHAMEQAREVFAIPGSIHNPMARGCHQLIRQGAKLVESVSDILEELAPQLQNLLTETSLSPGEQQSANSEISLEPEQQTILNAMGFDAITIDELSNRCDLAARDIASTLLILELQGHVFSEADGRYSRRYEQ